MIGNVAMSGFHEHKNLNDHSKINVSSATNLSLLSLPITNIRTVG
ncbi:hypothetical protein NBRC116591_05280 [Sessilibacter corallicola]|uniref:Uncharacterized protein n=1 Tax=Sessilibacter corallicola TaxID=2904075 RepID=A0ABQ0A5D5_9GAMM